MDMNRLEKALNAPGIDTKAVAVDVQPSDVNEQTGAFKGYLATYDLDQQKDQIVPGAFANTIAQAKSSARANGSRVLWALLFNHEIDKPIGGITEASEDSKGLFINGFVDVDSKEGQAVLSGMKRNYLQAMSIGYKTIRSTMKPGTNVRLLQEIQLYEGSIVVFPANPNALIEQGSIKSTKSLNCDKTYRTGESTIMTEVYSNRYYGTSEVADMLNMDKVQLENIVAYDRSIQAKKVPVGYLITGEMVEYISHKYFDEIICERFKSGKFLHVSVKAIDHSFSLDNASVINNLREAKANDLRLDKEADESEYQKK